MSISDFVRVRTATQLEESTDIRSGRMSTVIVPCVLSVIMSVISFHSVRSLFVHFVTVQLWVLPSCLDEIESVELIDARV